MLNTHRAIATLAVHDLAHARRSARGDVHVGGRMRVAWFKDPDGNVLNLASG